MITAKVMHYRLLMRVVLLLVLTETVLCFHQPTADTPTTNRRSILETSIVSVLSTTIGLVPLLSTSSPANAAASPPPSLEFSTSKSGIQWADAKVGTGPETKKGSTATVDYVLSTTGARYGAKIYSTKDKGVPYRWKLGDGSTITGLEDSIVGDGDSLPPMRPGGIRRVIIPPKLAYISLGKNNSCSSKDGAVNPIPPTFEEFQRFKNIYCNPERAYQPDIVMDIKLYGKRTSD
mmetsp:Transcript_37721/g.43085  ORF Transcript_37721/g.43085 Transcript_37721/m.43085 type:complete len:234 (+) Transcript_37721:3-704(+)